MIVRNNQRNNQVLYMLPIAPTLTFSRKQIAILQYFSDGLEDKTTAFKLGTTRHGVNGHLRDIFEKLEVHNRTHAVAKALRLGIIQ